MVRSSDVNLTPLARSARSIATQAPRRALSLHRANDSRSGDVIHQSPLLGSATTHTFLRCAKHIRQIWANLGCACRPFSGVSPPVPGKTARQRNLRSETAEEPSSTRRFSSHGYSASSYAAAVRRFTAARNFIPPFHEVSSNPLRVSLVTCRIHLPSAGLKRQACRCLRQSRTCGPRRK